MLVFKTSLPPCASAVFHHVSPSWWKDCQLFILPLCINPSSAYRKSQAPGLVQIGPSRAFPLPLKAPLRFYSSVFQGRSVWRIHPLMMKTQSVYTDLLIISHICTQDDEECWMEVVFLCLFIEEVYGKCSRKWKNKKDCEDETGAFLLKLEREHIEYMTILSFLTFRGHINFHCLSSVI